MTDTQNSAGVPVHHIFTGDQSDLRLRFNEAIGGGPNMNGDSGWIIHTNGRAADLESAIARITELEAHIAAEQAAMPTIWEDPAGKGYPCFGCPMTPAEAKAAIDRYAQEVIALTERAEGEPDRMREVVERCAKVAETVGDPLRDDDYSVGEYLASQAIAAAIRARETKP